MGWGSLALARVRLRHAWNHFSVRVAGSIDFGRPRKSPAPKPRDSANMHSHGVESAINLESPVRDCGFCKDSTFHRNRVEIWNLSRLSRHLK